MISPRALALCALTALLSAPASSHAANEEALRMAAAITLSDKM